MAGQFLTLMADLDDDSQELMSGWYKELQDAGFKGVQTPGLPFHISLATFEVKSIFYGFQDRTGCQSDC